MDLSSWTGAAIAVVAVVLSSGVAVGGPRAATNMIVGELTSQPIGHYDFCQQSPAECSVRLPSSPAPGLSEKGWAAIEAVNTSVNTRIVPKTDRQMFGREEFWTYPASEGDCEDFALLKRRELADRGFSLADLLLTVVRKPDGEGHAILTVRTADGDFVLDNLDPKVKAWNETAYVFVKRQSSSDTGRWVSIESARDVPVGSVR
ncbi:transglutaminase-like cysteine peptidase [Neorhizobium galegae]|uniref:Transglutaminase cysteine peptidase BTLCP n=1 Tax=Neorhizobium galegae bv. officinalis TaxID=323656 RepID=A0A0T7GEU1_NEOGA|nr:transglutaminase-like cysteine peptidase [Neorhizobium galegae]CDZ45697.1 Transglutaminase cysteine peptidase BTLCP [Neorhizobium galegae bv. officinalis]